MHFLLEIHTAAATAVVFVVAAAVVVAELVFVEGELDEVGM